MNNTTNPHFLYKKFTLNNVVSFSNYITSKGVSNFQIKCN